MRHQFVDVARKPTDLGVDGGDSDSAWVAQQARNVCVTFPEKNFVSAS